MTAIQSSLSVLYFSNYIYLATAYQLYKKGGLCSQYDKLEGYFAGYFSVDGCYEKCKNDKLFHIHTSGANCKSDGCWCACYRKSDANGGCQTKPVAHVDLYRIKTKGKLARAKHIGDA